jgi:hypothetical protein
MTASRKIRANQANALNSTGPRSLEGKGRARCNALKHGLNVATVKDSGVSAAIARLADIIRKQEHDSASDAALVIAETSVDLARVRDARAALLEPVFSAPQSGMVTRDPSAIDSDALHRIEQLQKLDRYERRALSRRARAFCDLARLPRSTRR